jgi:hypothetical protein
MVVDALNKDLRAISSTGTVLFCDAGPELPLDRFRRTALSALEGVSMGEVCRAVYGHFERWVEGECRA